MGDKNYNKIYDKKKGNDENPILENDKDAEANEAMQKAKELEAGNQEGTKELEEVVQETQQPKEPKSARVVDRVRLNVRQKPSKDSEILCVLSPKEGLIIAEYVPDLVEGCGTEWGHIYTTNGIEGYVVKEYIEED